MQLKKIIPAFAIAMGLVLALATSGFRETPKPESAIASYYFEFVGTNGQEDQPTKWSSISEQTYLESSCDAVYRGCMLATTTVTGSGPSLHPSQVDVNIDPNNIDNKSPKTGNGVIDVRNRVSNY